MSDEASSLNPVSPTRSKAEATVSVHAGRVSELTVETLVDLQIPSDVRISPSGKHVVYSLQPTSKAGDYEVSSLWIAQVGGASSARQLTSGEFNDECPRWSPDSGTVAFISDRAEAGQSSAVYLLPLNSSLPLASCDPLPVTEPKNQKRITSLEWSPDGKHIAFLSPDEMSDDEKAKIANKDDAILYHQDWDFNRLRILDAETHTVQIVVNKPAHVLEFAWNVDSDQLVYVTQKTTEPKNSALYNGVTFETVCIKTGRDDILWCFSGPISQLTWFQSWIYFLAGFTPDKDNSARAVYRISQSIEEGPPPPPLSLAFGEVDEAVSLRSTKTSLAVQVQKTLKDEILLLRGSSRTVIHSGLNDISAWDILHGKDGDFITVYTKGSPSSPTEVYSSQTQWVQQMWGTQQIPGVQQLSNHGRDIAARIAFETQFISTTAEDGTKLNGVVISPGRWRKPWPTIVIPHEGPHTRINLSFDSPRFHWVPWLVAAGYAILCPNYRGGSGRGEKFASSARGGMGTKDYSDILAMIHYGIDQKIFHPEKVAIGGWAQGGFLSYLAMTRWDFNFRAAVCGAGITDWDMLTMTSDVYAVSEELAGGAPWLTEEYDTKSRKASPVWHVGILRAPILILHGAEDKIVPLSQAIAFHRGCRLFNRPCEMIVYPREPHIVAERAHRIDMLKRIRRFYDLHMA